MPRLPVHLMARCRTAAGMRDAAVLTDISTQGCGLRLHSLHVTRGMRVLIRPDGLEAIPGVVRWIAGEQVGVEFDAPLYGPVVDFLARTYDAARAAGTGAPD
ncbi:PilZ domain-containing protein [Novosphingobium sp. FSY-8]|uniref:PilZ domain-containing protein n=2 Tax=Novosphingobium ovatum TaxID=1908523 RepID=A0ABW9XAB7_9SPHN|nr:PilZ domain-containing protein [Novosphingobium ovatum]